MQQPPAISLHCTTTSPSLGNPARVKGMVGKTIQGGAGYTGTITIEGRQTEDGSWGSLGTVAAGAFLKIDQAGNVALYEIRTNCTTVVGGDPPTASLAYFNPSF